MTKRREVSTVIHCEITWLNSPKRRFALESHSGSWNARPHLRRSLWLQRMAEEWLFVVGRVGVALPCVESWYNLDRMHIGSPELIVRSNRS